MFVVELAQRKVGGEISHGLGVEEREVIDQPFQPLFLQLVVLGVGGR